MQPITYAYLETTNYCNLDCSFCNRKDVIGPLKHISIDKWGYVLKKIAHFPIKDAKLMGMGEPFLHPNFGKITEMFKETFPECFVIVATNCQYTISKGTRMREVFEESLKHIDMLYLSIDGYEEAYERDRAPAKWSRLITFLEDLQSINIGKCSIVVNYVVNKYNVYDIPKVEKLIEKYSLGELRINIAQIWDPNTALVDDERIWGYDKEQLEFLKTNYHTAIKGRSEWKYSDCFWINNGLYMTVDGDIKACCMNTAAKPFGNIFEKDINEIRDEKDYQNVRRGCLENTPTGHCKQCSYKELAPLLNSLGVSCD